MRMDGLDWLILMVNIIIKLNKRRFTGGAGSIGAEMDANYAKEGGYGDEDGRFGLVDTYGKYKMFQSKLV